MNKQRLIFLFVMLIMLLSFISYALFVLASGDGGTPLIELKSPFNNKIDLDGNIIFAYNVTDPVADIANCSLIFDGLINQTNSSINTSKIQYFTLNDISNGDYNWSVNCTNNVNDGNGSATWNITVFIDTTAPTVTLNGPTDGSTDTDGNVILNYTVNDNGWITNCSLYTDINGTWQINQTNPFIQKNTSSYFEIDNIPDDTTFKWNILCHDFALFPNSDWADANWSITIDNTAPTYSTIPDQEWNEDNPHTINLSNYFSDADGDNLNYNSTIPDDITVSIDDYTVTLNPDLNWDGKKTIVFYAFDVVGENATSNTVTLIVNPGSDDTPRITFASPSNNSVDTDGYVFFNCSAFDDYNLVNISLYTNISGTWEINQTKSVSGNYDSVLFNLTDLSDGSYDWNCLAYDNASQSGWGENRTFNVNITADIYHNIIAPMVENYTYNYTAAVSIGYSIYLNNSLTLGNLTTYLSNGTIYFTKNMSNSSKVEIDFPWWENSMMIHKERINITPYEIFYGNLSVGNEEWLNMTIQYYYKNNEYLNSEKVVIGIIERVEKEKPSI